MGRDFLAKTTRRAQFGGAEANPTHALSLRQPWAALVVAGLKSIEIRGWSTARRGRVWIHAASLADNRPEAWQWVSGEMGTLAALRQGIVGSVELTGCVAYRRKGAFAADLRLHLNALDWFDARGLYGFTLSRPRVCRFRPMPGNVKFFTVRGDSLR